MNYDVGIVGCGHVGSIMKQLFSEAAVYDKYKQIGIKDTINSCKFVFVCVPTPKSEDGSCDTAAVDEVLDWVSSKSTIILRSTVPVGYTRKATTRYSKHIVFQPEYYGETVAHPFADPHNRSWITLGGNLKDTYKVAQLYQHIYTSELIINQVDYEVAELAKYMENTFYATKVSFCNQFYDLAKAMNIDYNQLRETWLLDPRISRSHTFVYEDDRGYGGSCLPKDTAAILHQAEQLGVDMSILSSIEAYNQKLHASQSKTYKEDYKLGTNNSRFWEST